MSATRIVVFGGQVIFNEPTWIARAWSGADTGTEADFNFRSAQVFGNYLSGAVLERDLAVFETLIEGLLSPFGLDLRYPEVRQPFGATGIEITPLTFSMSNAPIGYGLLIPLLNTDLLRNYRLESVSEDCRRETFWTLIDALERALGGSGSIDMVVGGAIATTDDTDYSFKPFDQPSEIATPPPESAPMAQPPADLDTTAGFDDFGSGDSYDGFDTGYTDDLGYGFDDDFSSLDSELGTIDDEVPAEVTAVDESATTSGPDAKDGREIAAGLTGDSEDDTAALVVGIVALLGALGLSLGDRIMGLRARRRIA